MAEFPIYNCHIHTFTDKDAPPYFLKFKLGSVFGYLLSKLSGQKWFIKFLIKLMGDRDGTLGRELRLIETGKLGSQKKIFKEIQKQYPAGTVFVALPMDMKFMGVGEPLESIDQQHEDLLKLAKEMNGLLMPFYAADPREYGAKVSVRKGKLG